MAMSVVTTRRVRFHQVRQYVTYGSVYQWLVAAAKSIVAFALLSVPLNPSLVVAVLVTLTVYTHNQLTDLEEDRVNRPEQAAFAESRRWLLTALSAVSYVLALVISVLGGLASVLLTLLPAVSAYLYGVEWIPVSSVDRLKEVLVLNTGVVAFAWAVPLAYLPLTFDGELAVVPSVVVFAFFFLRTFLAVEVFNVRDVEGDRQQGVSTLPVAFGVQRTKYALYALDLLSLLVVAVASAYHVVPAVSAVALAPAIAYSLYVNSRLDDGGNHSRLFAARDLDYAIMAVSLVLVVGIH
ncbi:MAG: UbiA family prenyltransferase [Halobacteriota archaeon]